MHPAQVLDMQADLLVRSQNERYQEGIAYHVQGAPFGRVRDEDIPIDARRFGSEVARRMEHGLRTAYAYYVAPEMTDVVSFAAAGLDNSDVFRRDELPTVSGFVYFEKPLEIHDVRGNGLLAHAALWQPAIARGEDGRDIPAIGAINMIATPEKIEAIIQDGQVPSAFTNVARLMHSYFLLLNQTVTVSEDAQIPRQFAKRARRMEIPDRVTIVRLRRRESHGHGDSQVEWSHRWWCRGHWRWQHVSEHHPLAEPDGAGGWKARIWVRDHIKGPDDKPLVITDKVYGLVR